MRTAMLAVGLGALCGLAGCGMDVLHPAGPVAVRETRLLLETTLAMLIVVIPVLALTVWFAWRYRASATRSRFDDKFDSAPRLEFFIWGIPLVIVIVLSVTEWRSTVALDPFRVLPGNEPVLHVQAVAMDWKWLFIYPDQHIATLNRLVIPTGTDIAFDITSDGVMNVFFIPQLGTQIYAMAGMTAQDHLLAKDEGVYPGFSANFSGAGFPDMRFDTDTMTPSRFSAWVRQIQADPGQMDAAEYERLKKPGTIAAPENFGAADPMLFDTIVRQGNGVQTPIRATPVPAQEKVP
jgi:cytochrome o ubiquinol oxidase subunit II